ncbi:MAG: hypothetical protein HY819_15340 [Acidobacteria bacterium]|nr:hypothetical protein [Acidobacteriota bacterium]
MNSKNNPKPSNKPNSQNQNQKQTSFEYRIGDEISFAAPQGMFYGKVVKLVSDPISPAVEIEFEDGRKEIKKVKDRSLHLLRRASGRSEADEKYGTRSKTRDYDIDEVRRSEQKRGSRH